MSVQRRVSPRVADNREMHARYKEDVESEGKPFFPWAMFHDTVMSLVVVTVIAGLACIWYFTSGEDPEDAGWLGPRYTEEADPGTTNFIPRPDWYFYFLFYLLRIFKWPDSVILGTVGIPTILLLLLVALPFIDIRRERRPLHRPVAMVTFILVVISMGVLTYKGATAEEALGADEALIDEWMTENNLPEEARDGAVLFAEAGCMQCHTYLGAGSQNLGAPDLTDVGAQGRGVEYFERYVADPSQFGNNVMPKYGETFTEEQLNSLAVFLDASKGGE